ncbi:RNA 2'-phosphotransferase [Dyella nitratireducens]|uniref:RNA 2'-phosphotransferase n=1 Tax=Dyella nitratireducens TaxID=1849580 RepID=UPI00166B311B|nr:RNA 2'-phosphotransferase [Dyella nitratireducens]GLQ43072.1 putative RNA 2'-phosphotransferase [Dyella nitratireducens]
MDHVTISKFLSLVLRHDPEAIGLQLDKNGWANVDDLIRLANARGRKLDRRIITDIVASSDKQRFTLDDAGVRIRANQGHSISVDLELQPLTPPSVLFHGTATRFVESIRTQGLQKRQRQHVHLSEQEATAVLVGQRHGHPLVLTVQAGKMCSEGHRFYKSKNGVWLTDSVPASFISFPD